MANQEHLDILKQGVEVWNKWREEHPEIQPVLTKANLVGANLKGGDFRKTDLSRAIINNGDLSEANLSEALLVRADLWEANLSKANLIGADFWNAELHQANLSETLIMEANLSRAGLREANHSRADLTGANLSEADLSEANLMGSTIYGISAWNTKLENTIQSGLIITRWKEPTITVDNLEVAQFIYLMLNNKKIREVINTIGQKGVLILGRFGGGGLEFLHAIAAKLREKNYLPIIFDFEKPDHRDFTETIMTLAGLSRFVIADLSGASVPNELRSTIPYFKIPFVPIIEQGEKYTPCFLTS